MTRWTPAIPAALLLGLAASCSDSSSDAQADANGGLRVVATTGMVADLARQIAGEHAAVINLLGEGIDPHQYQPTRSDIDRLLDADLVLYNGLHLEAQMHRAFEQVAGAGKPVHAIAEVVPPADLLTPEDFEGHPDPHVWMDPKLWRLCAEKVRDLLIESDAANADAYRENTDAYLKDLEKLDRYSERVLSSVPAEHRVLVSAHDAFGYFGDRYGFEVLGIQGTSTEAEAGVFDVERLVNLLVERSIPAVFIESTVSERQVKALQEGAEARGHDVAIGGELFSDAMGTAGTYEGTWIGMIDHNVTHIARALGGNAPEGGMRDEPQN